jgi:hypothetical protein
MVIGRVVSHVGDRALVAPFPTQQLDVRVAALVEAARAYARATTEEEADAAIERLHEAALAIESA